MASARDQFPRFLREFVRPYLKPRGYTHAGRVFRRTEGPATAHLVFMRYTGARAGHLDVRMSLTLDPYAGELGVVLSEDLSRRTYVSVGRAPWRWPCDEPGWPSLAAALLQSVTPGAQWLESCFHLPTLAAHLERERRFTPDVDDELAQIGRAMAAAGISTLYQSPGYATPRAGKLRPHKVAALSYCYELMAAWGKSLDAWKDYMTTLHDPADLENPRSRKAHERCAYLQGRVGSV